MKKFFYAHCRMLYYLTGILVLNIYCVNLYSQDSRLSEIHRYPVMQTIYGPMELSDTEEFSRLLHRLPKRTDNFVIDMSNTLAVIYTTKKSDGALAEMMGAICMEDFKNKPKIVCLLYAGLGFEDLRVYLLQVASELYFDAEMANRPIQDVLIDYVRTFYTKDLSNQDIAVLKEMIVFIKNELKKYDEIGDIQWDLYPEVSAD